jgi:hypothetical protein
MPLKVIQPQNSDDPIDYLVMVPYESELAKCCASMDLRTELDPTEADGPISQDHAYVPGVHLSEHEFNSESDQDVATAATSPGVGATSIGSGEEPENHSQEELEAASARELLARTELRRRGYSESQTRAVLSGKFWARVAVPLRTN